MKEYKLVHLNKGIKLTRESDLKVAEEEINKLAKEGYTLQQIASPNDLGGTMVGLFYIEK